MHRFEYLDFYINNSNILYSIHIIILITNEKQKYPLQIRKDTRLRIGYVSRFFTDNCTAHLMQSLPATHSRDNVEVFCYALSPEDGSYFRRNIKSGADHFVDLSGINEIDVLSDRIHADGIHILVNMDGYTGGAAHSPWPHLIIELFRNFRIQTRGGAFVDCG